MRRATIDPTETPPWLDVAMPYEEPIEGMPAFVTPRWFQENTRLSPTLVRRMCEEIGKRRRRAPDFLPWWPAGKVDASAMFWCLARACLVVGDSEALCSLVHENGRTFVRVSGEPGIQGMAHARTGGIRPATPFAPLMDRHEVITRDGKFTSDRLDPEVVFATVYEHGAQGASYVLHTFMTRGIEPGLQETWDWYVDRHPEAYDLVEKEMGDKERRRAKALEALEAAKPAAHEIVEPEIEDPPANHAEVVAALEVEKAALRQDLADLDRRHADLQREIAAVRAGHDPRLRSDNGVERIPETMAELLEWIEIWLPPNVHLLPRAFRSLKRASDVDVHRLATGLRFLRDVYAPWRSDRGMTYDDYKAAQIACGFEETACFADKASLKTFADHYGATWDGRAIELDRHLKRGYGTDPKVMMRIYFTWDRPTETVVVGHLPGHLPNWKS